MTIFYAVRAVTIGFGLFGLPTLLLAATYGWGYLQLMGIGAPLAVAGHYWRDRCAVDAFVVRDLPWVVGAHTCVNAALVLIWPAATLVKWAAIAFVLGAVSYQLIRYCANSQYYD